ncbi:hypothetical protein NUU61_002133 [Penicillium alfredii]|uniref:Uncharacterized protein n=1 Tax=Penicillium alfredii TaxID=1506179 RepID=A0A9W9FQY9_9EURO|nr:uncharacterized protein NUU61_002133 [Penicillium alfredii]KAJ5104786.1 hypothetical protein NUU61_002133 [Penicillium alfredii]
MVSRIDWTKVFYRRLQTFLKAMISCEDAAIKEGRLTEDERLSTPMQESWESGDFWIAYTARNIFAFDSIYWQEIDQREKDKDEMVLLVAQKLKEMESRILAWDPDEYTRSHIDIAKTFAAKKNGNEDERHMESDGVATPKSDDYEASVRGIEARPDDTGAQQISERLSRLST